MAEVLVCGIPISLDNLYAVIFMGFKNSSKRISAGCILANFSIVIELIHYLYDTQVSGVRSDFFLPSQ
jgi:hypothetical protein